MRIRYDSGLPSGYKEVKYIENTGSAYLDTGIIAANKLFEIDLQFTSNATRQLMGIAGSGSEYFGIHNSGPAWERLITGKTTSTTITLDNGMTVSPLDRVTIMYDVGNIATKATRHWIQGSSLMYAGSCTEANWNTNSVKTFRLFRLGDSSAYNCKMRLYKLKVYNSNNVLINHFIPCIRNSDAKTGVYDLINNNFIATSTNMSIGSSILTNFKIRENRLPSIYQEVEYIGANGVLYIDTGIIPSYINGFDIRFKFSVSTLSKRYCLLSNYNVGPGLVSLELYNNNDIRYWHNTGSSDIRIGKYILDNNYAVFKYENGSYYGDGNGTILTGTTNITAVPTSTMYLFLDRNKRSSTFDDGTLKIHSFKMISLGEILADYIPCYRKSDGVIGMYDAATRTFKTNDGTGAFSKGADVNKQYWSPRLPEFDLLPTAYTRLKYIQSSGTLYINTNYYWTTENASIIADFEVLTNPSNLTTWGAEDYTASSGTARYFSHILHGSNGSYGLYLGSTTNGTVAIGLNTRTKLEISTKDNKVTVIKNGDIISGFNQKAYSGSIQAHNSYNATEKSGLIYIFSNHNSTRGTSLTASLNIGAMRLYSFKMIDNDVLVRWFVPCYRKSDDKVGLFDIVLKIFYTNTGNENFIKGDEL